MTSSGQRSRLNVLKPEKLNLKKRRASKKRVTDMHPDATTVLDLKAFYFLEQAIPDMQNQPIWQLQKVYHQTSKYWNGGISRKNYHIGQQPAGKSCCASHHPQLLKVFLCAVEFIW